MASPEDSSLPLPGSHLELEAIIEGSHGRRFCLMSYCPPPAIAAFPPFCDNDNLRVYATMSVLQTGLGLPPV
eukprot:6727336-Heterocapsa_arctica.AAC.1